MFANFVTSTLLTTILTAFAAQGHATVLEFDPHGSVGRPIAESANAEAKEQFSRWVLERALPFQRPRLTEFATKFLRARTPASRLQIFKDEFNRNMGFTSENRRAILWAYSLLELKSCCRLDARMNHALLEKILMAMRGFESWDELTRPQYQQLWTLILEGEDQTSLKILERVMQAKLEPWYHSLIGMETAGPLYWVYKQHELEIREDIEFDPNYYQSSLWRQTLHLMLQPRHGILSLGQARFLGDLLSLIQSDLTPEHVRVMQMDVVSHIVRFNPKAENVLAGFLNHKNPDLRYAAFQSLLQIHTPNSVEAQKYLQQIWQFTVSMINRIATQSIPDVDRETLDTMMFLESTVQNKLKDLMPKQEPKEVAAVELPAIYTCEVIIFPNQPKKTP